jgi:hypothetical protein
LTDEEVDSPRSGAFSPHSQGIANGSAGGSGNRNKRARSRSPARSQPLTRTPLQPSSRNPLAMSQGQVQQFMAPGQIIDPMSILATDTSHGPYSPVSYDDTLEHAHHSSSHTHLHSLPHSHSHADSHSHNHDHSPPHTSHSLESSDLGAPSSSAHPGDDFYLHPSSHQYMH